MGQPLERVQETVRNYILSDDIQRQYPLAYKKWSDAEAMLWSSDSEEKFTTVGHLCREAFQEFATYLVEKYQPPNVDENKSHDVARIKAVLAALDPRLGETEKPFLSALLAYWGTLSDLIQRQEHGAQKEGEPLVWVDARRVVFQTAILMFEIDSSLKNLR